MNLRKALPALCAVLFVLGLWQTALAGAFLAGPAEARMQKIDPALWATMVSAAPDALVPVVVQFKEQANVGDSSLSAQPDRRRALINLLKVRAQASQNAIAADLENGRTQGRLQNVTNFWIINGFSLAASADFIAQLAARPDVAAITPDEIDIRPVGIQPLSSPGSPALAAAAAGNLAAINAPALWNLGYLGQGVVVANLDSGVDISHPELSSRWRGGANSWYDPYNQHSTPFDATGHGTWTMGVMVAGSASGTSLGVAPQAKWIAARIFNDSGSATTTAIHLAFQWILDPDGNPATADAPQVVNNSWAFGSPGCNLAFQNDLKALRAAGILPIFAAGNYGPNDSTSVSPANYPEAFSVGAIDNTGSLDSTSSRGPANCGGASPVYPSLVAPGVNITTTDKFGFYTTVSGTSLSAPHVAGGVALLLSAFPGLNPETKAFSMSNTAVDLGTAGPDNNFGNGKLNLQTAYNWLASGSRITPTPLPSPTPSATSTPSSSPTPTQTAVSTATPDLANAIFADGFESGSLAAWSASAIKGGLLMVSSPSALLGVRGLQGTISSVAPIYVQDDSPLAETAYHARFYFSPNTVDINNSIFHDLLVGRSATGTNIFQVQFGRFGSGYAARILGRSGAGYAVTAWQPLGSNRNAIEISWKAASSASAANGSAEIYLNGVLAGALSGLSNGKYSLEDVRLGPQGLTRGISGIEYFDDFVSTRFSYIGP